MSRAALGQQVGGSRGREIRAEEIFDTACEEGRRKSSALPLWGDDTSFHFNPLLLQNCIQSSYFQKCCESMNHWNAVIDAIYYDVKNIHVFQNGTQPSTSFCLLLRLLTLRMTLHQLNATLQHIDSPYIRAIGFLYLRYVGQPDQIYRLVEPYLQDCEELTVERKSTTIGAFVRLLFQSRDFYGQTSLPRFPLIVERELQVQLLAADKVYERGMQHYKNANRMQQFQTVGCKVMALYGDDNNPITWYEAEVDRVITHDDNGPLKYPKFVVTFTEYGNTETVTLGELDVIGGRESSSSRQVNHYRSDFKNNNQYRNQESDLYDEVRRRERAQVASSGRESWSRRPPTTKASLSTQPNKVPERSTHVNDSRQRGSSDSNSHNATRYNPKSLTEETRSSPDLSNAAGKRSAVDPAAIAEKKRKLLAKYG
jgi:pre-mRNA-splicing factor 38B